MVLYPCDPSDHQTAEQGGDAGEFDDQLRQHAGKGGIAYNNGVVEGIRWKASMAPQGAGDAIGPLDAAGRERELMEVTHGASCDASSERGESPGSAELCAHDGSGGRALRRMQFGRHLVRTL